MCVYMGDGGGEENKHGTVKNYLILAILEVRAKTLKYKSANISTIKYSRLSLSQLRLSRITAYLEEKI